MTDKKSLWHGRPHDQWFSLVHYLTPEIEVSLNQYLQQLWNVAVSELRP